MLVSHRLHFIENGNHSRSPRQLPGPPTAGLPPSRLDFAVLVEVDMMVDEWMMLSWIR